MKNFVKGLIASADRYNQPQGSIPRGSNLLLSKRGSLVTSDGTQLIHAFNGVPTIGRGKILATFLFSPTGVPSYYLFLAQALDIPLGGPLNLFLTDGGAGGIFTGLVYYKITAMDGVGGETLASLENVINLPAGHKATLTWGVIPNAAYYNIYRGFAPASEVQLSGLALPVPQPPAGAVSTTFTDDGVVATPISLLLLGGTLGSVVSPDGSQITWTTTTPHNLFPGYKVACTNGGDARFNGNYQVQTTPSIVQFVTGNPNNVPAFSAAGPGNVTPLLAPTLANGAVDTTQQIVLFKMNTLPANQVNIPIVYTSQDIMALYPANLKSLSSPPSGGGGAVGTGGGGGGGGTGGGGGGGRGGRPILP